jgi:hypothetical protein
MNIVLPLAAAIAALALSAFAPQAASAGEKPGPMTQAPMKSNGSGVAVAWRIEGKAALGAPLTVRLELSGITDPAGASVRLVAADGLSLAASVEPNATLAGPAGSLAVGVVPGREGIGYLHVFTTQYGRTSAISVPVPVGQTPRSLRSQLGEARQTPGGEKILSMPVK